MYIACEYINISQYITIRLNKHPLLSISHILYGLSTIRLSEHSLLIILHVVYGSSTISLNEHAFKILQLFQISCSC